MVGIRRFWFTFALIASLISGAAVSPASASTLSIQSRDYFHDGGATRYQDLYYLAAPGERNRVSVRETPDGEHVVWADSGAAITVAPGSGSAERLGTSSPGLGCTGLTHAALCTNFTAAQFVPCGCEFGYAGIFGDIHVSTGDGNDRIAARDGEAELIGCGPGNDRVTADALDAVAADCEHVRVS